MEDGSKCVAAVVCSAVAVRCSTQYYLAVLSVHKQLVVTSRHDSSHTNILFHTRLLNKQHLRSAAEEVKSPSRARIRLARGAAGWVAEVEDRDTSTSIANLGLGMDEARERVVMRE